MVKSFKHLSKDLILHDDVIKWIFFSALLAVTRSFDVFFDMRLNKRLGKPWGRRWLETPLRSLWRHCNGTNGAKKEFV